MLSKSKLPLTITITVSLLNLIRSQFNAEIPRIAFLNQAELYYRKHGKCFVTRCEFVSDGLEFYFGEIASWSNGVAISDDERTSIKHDIEKHLPKKWNIGWR